jgi:hypothetical protein
MAPEDDCQNNQTSIDFTNQECVDDRGFAFELAFAARNDRCNSHRLGIGKLHIKASDQIGIQQQADI